MACNCKKISIKEVEKTLPIEEANKKITPLDQCNLCATKHLSLAMIIYDENFWTAIPNIFLAYLHLKRSYRNEALECLNLIKDFFNDELTTNKIKDVVEKVHNLKENEDEDETKNDDLNIFNSFQQEFIFILSAYEAFNNEVGYKDVNTPYVLGMIQKVGLLEQEPQVKNRIRMIWKNIEEHNDFSLNEARNIAYLQLQRLKNK